MRFVLYTLLFSVAAAFTGCGGGGGGSSTPVAPTTPAPLSSPLVVGLATPPPGSIYLGGFINPSGLPYGNTAPYVAAFETQLGRKMALDMQFSTFTSKFGGRGEQDDFANGRIPIFSWNCGSTNAQIASGAADDSIRLQADSVRTYAWPVFMRYLWDMNLPAGNFTRTSCWDQATDGPYQVNNALYFSPTEFIAAWTHIRQIFTQEGATNAIWLWTFSNVGANPLTYYPGASQVDWVGFDTYDLTGASFAATLAPSYALAAPLNKPIMVSSTGAGESIQTPFFDAAAASLQTQFPAVKAFVYYDGIGSQDWRITPSSLPAFSSFANSSYMAARYVP